ncbi:MAG: protein-glutamate O-methyltransferase CheR [Polyangiaceae bacterium]
MPGDDEADWDAELVRILACARDFSGVDFSSYRPSTMKRRTALRIGMTQAPTARSYLEKIQSDPNEMRALVDALLIKTTWMYREPRTFELLRSRALPDLFAQRAEEGAHSIHAWVPACSSGEEAYTLAMCLDEARSQTGLEFQLIASDVDQGALAKVKAAHYADASFESLPPDFAQRYLVPSSSSPGSGARVSDEIRSRVVVAHHDALRSDRLAPREAGVASFDVISCRNLMVYLKPHAQEDLMTRLQKTCMPGSLVVISDSESVRTATDAQSERPTLVAIEAKIPVFRVE